MYKFFQAIIICVLLLFTSNLFGGNYEEIWNLLLKNDRTEAQKKLNKIKDYNATMEGLLLEHLIKEQFGQNEFNNDFVEKGKKHGIAFEHVLISFMKHSFIFGDYQNEDFFQHQISRLLALEDYDFKSQTIRDSYYYILSNYYLKRKNYAKKMELGNSPDYIRKWKALGPFENLNKSGIHANYEVETQIELESYDANSNGVLSWYKLENVTEGPYTAPVGHQQYGQGTTYLKTYLDAKQTKDVLLRFGTNCAVKVWLNGREIFVNEFNYRTDLDYFGVKTRLKKGENLLLIKMGHLGYPYLSCKMTNIDGGSLGDVDRVLEGKGIPEAGMDFKSEIINNETLKYFDDVERESYFFSKICKISYYSSNGVKDKAREIIQELEKEYPHSSFLNYLLISCLEDDSKDQQLQTMYAGMELHDSTYYLPYVVKIIDFNQMINMSNESFDEFAMKVEKLFPVKYFTQLLEMIKVAKKNDLVGMKDFVEKFIVEYKENAKVTHEMINTLGLLGHKVREEELLKEMNEHFYYFPAIGSLASIYESQGKINESVELYSMGKEVNQNNFEYYQNLGNLLYRNAQYSDAIKQYSRALEIYPFSFTTLESIGDVLVQEKKESEAIEYFKKSLIHDTGNAGLRQKIKNLSVREDVFDKTMEKDKYAAINSLRRKSFSETVSLNFLYEEENIIIYKEGGTKRRVYTAYEIINTQGIDLVKELDLGLYNNYHIYAMEILKLNGQRISADRNGSHGVFNGLEVGDVVYLDYEYSTSGYGRFHKDFYSKFQIGGKYPVTHFRVRIFLPEGEILNYKICNSNWQPVVENKDGYQIYDWLQTNIPEAPVGENYIKNSHDVFPYLHVSTIDSWNDISNWYADLVSSQFEDSKIVQDLFQSLFPEGHTTMSEMERAEIIYKYMCKNLNYSFVSFRQSGFVPQKPEKTIRTKLGDCKDFSTLFAILAKKAGIDVELVLVLTSDFGRQSMVKPNQEFNHCIVKAKLENNTYYIELTDKYLPFLATPRSLVGAAALEIPIKSNKIGVKDIFNIEPNGLLKDYFKLKIDHFVSKTSQKIVLEYEIGGAPSSRFNALFMEGREVYEADLKDKLGRFDIKEYVLDSVVLISHNNFSPSVKYRVHLTIKDAFQKVGKLILVPLHLFDEVYTQDLLVDKRIYILDYQSYEDKDYYLTQYSLKLDNDFVIKEIPGDFVSAYKVNHYSLKITQSDERSLTAIRTFSTEKKDISIEEFDAFKDHVRSVLDVESSFIGVNLAQN